MSSGQPSGASPVRGDATVPGSGLPASVERPPSKRSDDIPSRGGQLAGPQHEAKPAASSALARDSGTKEEPSLCTLGEGQGKHLGSWSGCPRTSRRKGAWNGQKVVLGTGESLLGPTLRGTERGRL